MTWFQFYYKKCNSDYYEYINQRYKTFIDIIANNINKNTNVLEIGTGAGNITKALMKRKNARYNISDNSVMMLVLAKNNTTLTGFLHDARKKLKKKYDIIHSHGVLEHFSNREIKRIVKNLKKSSKKMIHYVPSNKYKTKSFGDERLLSKEEWQTLVNPDEILSFNNDHDLILKWSDYVS